MPRPLSVPEQALWWMDHGATVNFTTVARVQGRFDEPRLQAALAAVQARHPLLRVAIRDGAFVPDRGPLRARRVDGDDWLGEVRRELHTRFDTTAGPLCRCVWVRHGEDEHSLLLTLQHCIGDGKSGVFLMRDLLRAVSGADLPALPPAPSSWAARPRRLLRPWATLRALLSLGREVRRWLTLGRSRLPVADGVAVIGQREAHLQPLVFDAALTARLAERCRAERTTMHGLMTAVLLQTVAAEHGRRVTLGHGTPVDLRPRLEPPVGEDLGFYVSMVQSTHRVEPAGDVWALARAIRKDLVADVARGADILFQRLMGAALRFLIRKNPPPVTVCERIYGAPRPATGITNLGRLPVGPDFGALRATALHFFVISGELGDLTTSSTCFDGRLHWNLSGMAPVIAPDRLARFARSLAARLEAAAGQPDDPPGEGSPGTARRPAEPDRGVGGGLAR